MCKEKKDTDWGEGKSIPQSSSAAGSPVTLRRVTITPPTVFTV